MNPLRRRILSSLATYAGVIPSARLISGIVTLPSMPHRATCNRHRIPYSSFAVSFISTCFRSSCLLKHARAQAQHELSKNRSPLKHIELKLCGFAHHARAPWGIERQLHLRICNTIYCFYLLLYLKRQRRRLGAVRRSQSHLYLRRSLFIDFDLVNETKLIDINRNLGIVALMQSFDHSGLEIHAFKSIHWLNSDVGQASRLPLEFGHPGGFAARVAVSL